jgi:hypothetical protein
LLGLSPTLTIVLLVTEGTAANPGLVPSTTHANNDSG